jgi:diacylglycerol O-acyltransferase / wax synthase
MTIDRLSVLDDSMLRLDTPHTPLHTGGIGIFEPGLDFRTVQSVLGARLEKVPRARQKVVPAPLGGNAVWVDDDRFDLTYHLRHAALPPPGDDAQLAEFIARQIERPLDRTRPLWELYVVAGLAGGRTALFRKVHLAMAGGDRSDPFGVLLDEDPRPPHAIRTSAWRARPAPSTAELTRDTLQTVQTEVRGLVRDAVCTAVHPSRLVDLTGVVVGSAADVLGRVLGSAPRSPLNVELSTHRRFAFFSTELEPLRVIRHAFGGTINDVVVSVCADAVGRLLRWRGFDTGTLDLRVMVPVRVHGPVPATQLAGTQSVGEGAVGVLAPLPVMAMDPVARLYRIMGELAGVKESRQAVAAESLVRLAGYAPPTLHAIAARVVSGAERYNLALSNAPGPQTPRYLADVRMEASYPYLPLAGSAGLSIAVSSYAGRMDFGLLGDRDAVPDLEELPRFVGEALVELADAAGQTSR